MSELGNSLSGLASGGQSLAVYWGQGSNQNSLGYFCQDSTIDIIPIAFVNVFPDQSGSNGYPGTNFGNACGGYYVDSQNQTTQLLASCPQIASDITYCQSQGKKILLSLGGGTTDVFIASDDSATSFADFLYGAFGPPSADWTGPRPFGDASVDGFDFDIEATANSIPTALGFGYATMVNHLRTLGSMLITASPQCVVPDANLGNALANAYFDAIFVQFYNTPQCSARAWFDDTYGAYGGPATDISFDAWISWMQANASNPNALVYLGLPAATGATFGEMYLNTTEAQEILTNFQSKYPWQFGGAMLWEATFSENNQVNGKSYAANIKCFLTGNCGASTTTSSVPSSTPTNSANGTASGFPTYTPSGPGFSGSGRPTASGFPTASSSPTGSAYPTSSPGTMNNVTGSPYAWPTHNGHAPTGTPTGTSDVSPITTTDRHGNTFTYTPMTVQPTGTSLPTSSGSSGSSTTVWPDWDPAAVSTSVAGSSTSWGSWDPSSTASAASASGSSTSWGEWDPATTSSSSSSSLSSEWPSWDSTETWEATITASDASTVTVMPLPATSTTSPIIASWSSYWTQRASFSTSAAGASYAQSSSTLAAAAVTSPGSWSFSGSSAPLPSIATVTASTSAGVAGASGWASSSPSIGVYVQPFTGGGNIAKPIFGMLAAVIAGAAVILM